MINTILDELKGKILDLKFIERYGSIVVPVSQDVVDEDGRSKRITFPASWDGQGKACYAANDYFELAPNDVYRSVSYWELRGDAVPFVPRRGDRGKWYGFRQSARLVVWLNLQVLGIPETGNKLSDHLSVLAMNALQGAHQVGVDYIDGVRMTVERKVRKSMDIFGAYSYSDRNELLLYPYDFFAIDFQVEWYIKRDCVPGEVPYRALKCAPIEMPGGGAWTPGGGDDCNCRWIDIPDRPHRLSDFENDGEGENPFITAEDIPDFVESVNGIDGIEVDDTDPQNPIAKLTQASKDSLAKADSAVQPGDLADVATSGEFGDLQNIPDFIEESERDQPGGFAGVGMDGFIPSLLLPSYVDDVLEFADFASLPTTGESGKIYVTLDDNKTYRWSGSAYVEISSSLALGETSSTAYRGDRGKIAYDHSQQTGGNPHNVTASEVGLGNVDNTSDADKPVSTTQQAAIDQAETNANQYTDDEIANLNLGSAAQANVGDFATSAQGAKADSAVQPGDLPPPQDLQSVINEGNTTTNSILFNNSIPTVEYEVLHYQGAGSVYGGTAVGVLVLRMPDTGNAMLSMDIDIWRYSPGCNLKYSISGYVYNTQTSWYTPSLTCSVTGSGSTIFRLRFATDGNGDRCILIGDSTTTWAPHNSARFALVLSKISIYFSAHTGYSVELVTSEAEFTDINEPPLNQNISVDLLDGYHASEFALLESEDISPAVWVLDEDDMVSDSDTKVPTQQSVKAYVDANAGGNLFTDDLTLGSSRTHDLNMNTLRFDNGNLQVFGQVFQFYNDLGNYVVDIQLATDQIYFYMYHKSTFMTIGFIVNSSGITFYDGQNSPGSTKNVFLNHVGGRRGEWKPLTIPEYATDLDADNDSDLASGAPYSLTGDRTVYRKP